MAWDGAACSRGVAPSGRAARSRADRSSDLAKTFPWSYSKVDLIGAEKSHLVYASDSTAGPDGFPRNAVAVDVAREDWEDWQKDLFPDAAAPRSAPADFSSMAHLLSVAKAAGTSWLFSNLNPGSAGRHVAFPSPDPEDVRRPFVAGGSPTETHLQLVEHETLEALPQNRAGVGWRWETRSQGKPIRVGIEDVLPLGRKIPMTADGDGGLQRLPVLKEHEQPEARVSAAAQEGQDLSVGTLHHFEVARTFDF